MKPLIYIASPYTKGDQAINTRFQMQVFDELLNDGIVTPFVPLWSHFQHLCFPRPYQDWIDYDLELLPRMDACLRLNAEYVGEPWQSMYYFQMESSGADGEVKKMEELGKPVFYHKEGLYDWTRTWVPSMVQSV